MPQLLEVEAEGEEVEEDLVSPMEVPLSLALGASLQEGCPL